MNALSGMKLHARDNRTDSHPDIMPSFRRPRSFTLLLLLLAALTLSGCVETPDRLWLNAPDWSRAQFVGQTAGGDPPIFALGPDHSAAFLLIASEEGRTYPKAVFLDAQGQKRWERAYTEISMARPDQARAYWAGDGVQLFWLSNESLFHVAIDPANGEMTAPPQKLSGELRVGDYAVAVNKQGEMVVWFSGPRIEPGLYRFPDNDLASEPMLLDETGIRPALAFDARGALHALWAHYPMGRPDAAIRYAGDALNGPRAEDIRTIATAKSALGSVFSGPVMGLTADRAYIFWSIEIRTGVAAGSVDSRYLSFPLNDPQAATRPEQLYVPSDYHLPYEEWLAEGFRAGQRSPMVSPRTGKVTQIYANSSDLNELVIIQRALVQFTMRNNAFQIGTLFFKDGQPESYQLLSFTGGDSKSPVIANDADGWLYAAWLERGATEGFRIVYASTNPDIEATYAQLASEDYQSLAAQTLFGLVSGALLLPFAFMWMIVPLLLYLLTFFLRRNSNDLFSPGTLASLAISIGGYWVFKVGFLGGLMNYVPFSAWLPIIPDWLAIPLEIGVPLIILGLALWAAWAVTYKRQIHSSLFFLIIYLAVDAVLSTAIYGPLIFATN
jgi:hypothetical protein